MAARPIMFVVTLMNGKQYVGALGNNHGWYIDDLEHARRHAYYYIEFLIFPFATLISRGKGFKILKKDIKSIGLKEEKISFDPNNHGYNSGA